MLETGIPILPRGRSPPSLMVPPSEGMWALCPAIEETFHLVPLSLSLNHLQLFVFPAYVLSILGPSYVPEVSKDKDADPKEY